MGQLEMVVQSAARGRLGSKEERLDHGTNRHSLPTQLCDSRLSLRKRLGARLVTAPDGEQLDNRI